MCVCQRVCILCGQRSKTIDSAVTTGTLQRSGTPMRIVTTPLSGAQSPRTIWRPTERQPTREHSPLTAFFFRNINSFFSCYRRVLITYLESLREGQLLFRFFFSFSFCNSLYVIITVKSTEQPVLCWTTSFFLTEENSGP